MGHLHAMKKAFSRRLALGVFLIAAAGGAYYLLSGQQFAEVPVRKAETRATPVAVAQVTTRSVPVSIRTIGTVQARATVAVRSRVDGQILETLFAEGQMAKKGDPLFVIDPRPFNARLREAEANLARDQAALDKAKSDFARYQSLSDKGFSSQQKYEEARAAMNGLTATLRGDQAAVDLAKLDLEFATVRAPISGRTGSILVHPGNLVEANDEQPLVVINEIDPILASFAVPEHHLAEIKRRLGAGSLTVEARIPESAYPAVRGQLVFVNNAVDTQTGTIQLKAAFDNPDGLLTPGQFVHVTMEMDLLADARVVPERSLQQGRDGTYLFVVNPDMTVEPRPVTAGPSVDGLVAIGEALAVGDTVVTDGQMRLFKGAQVSFKGAGPKETADGSPEAGNPATKGGPAKAAN